MSNLFRNMGLYIFRQAEEDIKNKVLGLLERNNDAVLLDCGCGDGRLTKEFADKIGTRNIYGVDLDNNAIKQAKEKGIKTYYGDLNDVLPFDNNVFDVVMSHFVIEDLIFIDTFVKEIFRVLKPCGYAIITTENLASWHNIFALLIGYQDFTIHVSNEIHLGNPLSPHYLKKHEHESPLGHVRCLTYQSLKEIFEIYGFKIEEIIGAGYYPFPKIISSMLSSLDPRHTHFITVKVRKPKSSCPAREHACMHCFSLRGYLH